MFDLTGMSCPSCKSQEYQGDFRVQHYGSSKLLFVCNTECKECDFENEYTTSLT